MRRVIILLLLTLFGLACGGASDDGEQDGAAIDFTAETVGGGSIDMADYEGKPVALWFWSPW